MIQLHTHDTQFLMSPPLKPFWKGPSRAEPRMEERNKSDSGNLCNDIFPFQRCFPQTQVDLPHVINCPPKLSWSPANSRFSLLFTAPLSFNPLVKLMLYSKVVRLEREMKQHGFGYQRAVYLYTLSGKWRMQEKYVMVLTDVWSATWQRGTARQHYRSGSCSIIAPLTSSFPVYFSLLIAAFISWLLPLSLSSGASVCWSRWQEQR